MLANMQQWPQTPFTDSNPLPEMWIETPPNTMPATGSSPSPFWIGTPLPLSLQQSPGLRDSRRLERVQNTTIGSSWSVLTEQSRLARLNERFVRPATPSPLAPMLPMRMSGKRIRPSPAPNSSWALNQSEEIMPWIGKEFGSMLQPGTSTLSPSMSEFNITGLSNKLRKITSDLECVRKRLLFIGDLPVSENPIWPGKKPE